MKTISSIKRDMDFNKTLYALIEALKNIAVAQYRILERKIKSYEEFLTTVEGLFRFIDPKVVEHPFIGPARGPLGILAITSDSGLLGSLNMQVINRGMVELEKTPGKFIVIGERGKMYVTNWGVPYVAFPGIKEDERLGQAMQMRDYLVEKALAGSFRSLKIIYPRPISFTVQKVEVVDVIPFPLAQIAAAASEGVAASDVLFESTPGDIVEYLIYLWLGQKLFEIFGLSKLAEFSARFVHLEESHNRLKETEAKIRLEYFRVRHEIVDRNMRELFAARSMYGNR